MYYQNLGFSDCEVAGAVAEAALYDLRVNLFSFPGFPQIDISGNPDGDFTIVLRWNKAASVRFRLSIEEVESAVKKLRSRTDYDPGIFKMVQEALVDLETKASRFPTR